MNSDVDLFTAQLLLAAELGGARSVVELIGSGAPSRFTAIFELVDADLVNWFWFDKLGEPRPAFAESVPFRDSFCQVALREGEFRTHDSATDVRVQYSPYKGIIVSYCALPLVDFRGTLRGTVSHFDYEKVVVDDLTFELMRRAAKLLPQLLYDEHRLAMEELQRLDFAK